MRSCPQVLYFYYQQASSIKGAKHSLVTDYVLTVLGLDICSDTIVGTDMVRGISGGQKKRVTTGGCVFRIASCLFSSEIILFYLF